MGRLLSIWLVGLVEKCGGVFVRRLRRFFSGSESSLSWLRRIFEKQKSA
jgi:hypothetical protein